MSLTRLEVGKPHRSVRKLELVVRDYDAMRTERRTLEPGMRFQPWAPLEHWRGQEVPLTLGETAKEFDWGVTSPAGHFLEWDTFFEQCEPVNHVSNVQACQGSRGPVIRLTGLKEDIDSGMRMREGREQLGLEDATLLCEVLATGKDRRLKRTLDGRDWNLHWTLEDPRNELDQQKVGVAEQLVWFFPGSEDWCVFRMSCTELIQGLGPELAFLLRVEAQPVRVQLNAMVVLLDQAALRCGL